MNTCRHPRLSEIRPCIDRPGLRSCVCDECDAALWIRARDGRVSADPDTLAPRRQPSEGGS